MKKTKDKTISLRVSSELYNKYLDKTIIQCIEKRRIVKVSEVIREALEKGCKDA